MSGFTINGSDLDNYLEPYHGGTQANPTGLVYNGQDLSQRYQYVNSGYGSGGAAGGSLGLVGLPGNICNYFMAKGGWTAPATTHNTTFTTTIVRYTSGCVVEGTDILLPDGSTVKVESLTVGETLVSVKVPGLQPETVEDYHDYHADSLDGTEITTTEVAHITPATVSEIYLIEREGSDQLQQVTGDHPFFVCDEQGTIRFAQAQELTLDDKLVDEHLNEVAILSIEKVEGTFTIYKLDCSPLDLFIHNGIVGHNIKPGQDNPTDHQTSFSTTITRSTSN